MKLHNSNELAAEESDGTSDWYINRIKSDTDEHRNFRLGKEDG